MRVVQEINNTLHKLMSEYKDLIVIGEDILDVIGIDLKSFSLAGAFVIFLIAIEMILNIELFKSGGHSSKKVTEIVPLAFPLIAGSGTLTTLLSLKAIETYTYVEIFKI